MSVIHTQEPPTPALFVACRFWWAKLRGLAIIGDYDEIERFSRQKKSPIGYEVSTELTEDRDVCNYVRPCPVSHLQRSVSNMGTAGRPSNTCKRLRQSKGSNSTCPWSKLHTQMTFNPYTPKLTFNPTHLQFTFNQCMQCLYYA